MTRSDKKKQISFKLKQLLQLLPGSSSYVFALIQLLQAGVSVLFCQQSKGTFSQSHYYLALYRFKAIEKDDLDFQ